MISPPQLTALTLEARGSLDTEHWRQGAKFSGFRKPKSGASLVVQWLRIHLVMQGTPVRTLDLEDPTCCKATKPLCLNC